MKPEHFYTIFATETQCIEHLVNLRFSKGITCRECGEITKHNWVKGCQRFYCQICHHQTTLRSGTVMESSKLPIRYWFWAMFLMTNTSNPISCKELCFQLGHSRYNSIWFMMHKIRALMGKRDSKYLLKNVVEMDDAFVTTFREKLKTEATGYTRGRGSERMTKMFVMAESKPETNNKRRGSKPGFIRMVALEVLTGEAAEMVAKECISPDSTIKTDGYKGFKRLKKGFANHHSKVIPAKQGHIELPWVHLAIANIKASLSGIYRKISDRWIQNYLDEHCYRANRRYFKGQIFERLVMVALINNLT